MHDPEMGDEPQGSAGHWNECTTGNRHCSSMIKIVTIHKSPKMCSATELGTRACTHRLETVAGDPNPGRGVQVVEEQGRGLHLVLTGEHVSGLTRWGTDVGIPEDETCCYPVVDACWPIGAKVVQEQAALLARFARPAERFGSASSSGLFVVPPVPG